MKREDYYHYIVDRTLSCTVVAIPYQDNSTALFILPREGKMKQVENGLNEGVPRNWLKMSTKRYFLGHSQDTSFYPGETHAPGPHSAGGEVSSGSELSLNLKLPMKSLVQDLPQLEG